METATVLQTPIGRLVITATAQGITAVRRSAGVAVSFNQHGTMIGRRLARGLRRYFRGQAVDFSRYPLDFGTATLFQIAVWRAARRIGFGRVQSYGQLARAIGKPRAARAVGNAMHANPFLIVVPCHRVVQGDGTLGGFGAGRKNKEWLLRNEGYRIKP